MKWIEAIHLRANRQIVEDLIDSRFPAIDAADTDEHLTAVTVFRNPEIDSDLNIHLIREADQPGNLESNLGRIITQGLQHYGLVNYFIWVEKYEFTGRAV